jgi:hypothetical protein
LVALGGVHTRVFGFWDSRDGGATWTSPKSFLDTVQTVSSEAQATDVSNFVSEPDNFDHLLVSSHSPWSRVDSGASGLFETKDGGLTWNAISPVQGWSGTTKAIGFVEDPGSGLPKGQTWIVGSETNGYWKTTHGGGSWQPFLSSNSPHGGASIYPSATGHVYIGATGLFRTNADGHSPNSIESGGGQWRQHIFGTGAFLFTGTYYGGGSMMVSLESDGTQWLPLDSSPDGLMPWDYEERTRTLFGLTPSGRIYQVHVPEFSNVRDVRVGSGITRSGRTGCW